MSRIEQALSEYLADRIVEIIRDQELVPGDALDSSRALAQRFDVTTPTVREALRRLEAIDIVYFRHGSGTYVGPGIDRRILSNPHQPTIDQDSVLELVDARLVLEPPIAAAAARTRADRAMGRLEEALTNSLHPPEGDTRPAVHFHVALAAASGNRLLEESLDALLQVRRPQQVEIRHRYDDRERDHREHVRIFEAVRDGDPGAAETLTRDHLGSIRDTVAAADFART
jgi:GntR family transcriptional regulator, transcriptional repressor for pyruvate dehydrogenase complex